MSDKKKVIGKVGEQLATAYLKQNGFHIIERNYRQKWGEIDIIARDKKTIVFVEVKTRKSNRFGSPFEAVTTRKQQQIARTAHDYLCRNNLFNKSARFDVIGIILSRDDKPSIELIQNAFSLSG